MVQDLCLGPKGLPFWGPEADWMKAVELGLVLLDDRKTKDPEQRPHGLR